MSLSRRGRRHFLLPRPFFLIEVIDLNIMGEIAIIFGICLVSEGISSLLPIPFPASVLSMLILLVLLLTGAVQDRHIRRTCGFFTSNMAFFFIPPCVGILDHVSTLSAVLVPFLLISIITTPLVYLVTAWVIQCMMRVQNRRASHD